MSNDIVKYTTDAGADIQLTLQDAKAYFSDKPEKITDKEAKIFLETCRAQRLNPFLREAYLVKYGDAPAQIMPGKEGYTKRAHRNPNNDGWKAGVTVIRNGEVHRREGCMVIDGEKLIGGWAEVKLKDKEYPFKDEVALSEYSTGQNLWKTKPATMIRKVALMHVLREAFPEDCGWGYDASEVGYDGNLPEEPISLDQSQYSVSDIPAVTTPDPQQHTYVKGPSNPLLVEVADLLQEYKTRMGWGFTEAQEHLETRLPFSLAEVGDNQGMADIAMYAAREMLAELDRPEDAVTYEDADILF